uniref:Inhibitor I9 domain-containing protein n=1 Tax=Ananas comosus var. bracteatus TaxID=296719 RepID=A0A6V7PQ56_ANACO|nr:unnamed protein product [Ananas comosus var. bracteatus]
MEGSSSFPITSLIILFLSLFSLSLIDASTDDDKPSKYFVFISRPQNVDPVKFDIDLVYSVVHSTRSFPGGGGGGGGGGEGADRVRGSPEGADPEEFHIRTLGAVLGSEEAAKEAVIYHYTHAASGFSAKLTPKQVEELQKQAGVLQVVPSRTYQLHGPSTATQRISII